MKRSVTAACFGGTLLATSMVLAQAQPATTTQPNQANKTNAAQNAQNQNAQQNSTGRTTTATTQGQGQGQGQADDRMIAACVAIKNQEEVAIAQSAKDKLKDEDVKKFADTLVRDHQQFLQKLQRFTPEASHSDWLQTSSDSTTSGVQRAGGTQQQGQQNRQIQQTSGAQQNAGQDANRQSTQITTQTGVQGSSGQGQNLTQIRREIAQECVNSARKKLNEKDQDADKCFLGMQVAAHMAMVNELTVLQRHASGELRQILAEGQESAQHHLEQAESLMKDQKHDSDRSKDSSSKNNRSEKSSKDSKND